jgi:hypothetical protein
MSYVTDTIKQIDEKDSKDSRWDLNHFLSTSSICGCKNCYCCCVRIWYNSRQGYNKVRADNVI